MVDCSGASVTAVGDEAVKAVQAESPSCEKQYKLADGSFIPHKGNKTFKAVTDLGLERQVFFYDPDGNGIEVANYGDEVPKKPSTIGK